MTVNELTTTADVDGLIAGICDSARTRPWCVISTPFDSPAPRFDIAEIERQVGDLCAIFLLPTGDLSRRLSAALPEHTDAYGGAARSFPPGDEWVGNPRLTQLRWIPIPSQAEAATDRVIGDLFTMAYQAGLTVAGTTEARTVAGVVKSIVAGTRAMVQLDSGEFATIVHELTFPEVPLNWVIVPGQRVSGAFDPETKRLNPHEAGVTPDRLLDWYPNEDVTLALVLSTDRQRATLAVHPSVPITVERGELSSNPRDRADLLLTPGDVVAVRVIRNHQGRVGLRTRDIDDDEPIMPAPSVFEGGDPWLRAQRVLSTPDDELSIVTLEDFLASNSLFAGVSDESATSARVSSDGRIEAPTTASGPQPARPGPGPRPAMISKQASEPDLVAPANSGTSALKSALGTVDALKSEVNRLQARLARLGGEHVLEELQSVRQVLGESLRERDAARERAASLDLSRRETQALLRQARSAKGPETGPLARRGRFAQDEDWVRHEIYLAWIERLDAADRDRYPLPEEYRLGPAFAGSLEGMDVGQLQKIFRAVVDVLTGYVRELTSRNVHPLREGTGASAATVTRSDGAVCFRAYIEQNTPSARRLHYWQTPSQPLELSRVVLHDDMNP